jgi:mono/diheme cytochrome c family protein
MGRSRRLLVSLPLLCAAAVGMGACGTKGIELSKSDPNYRGAELFATHCSGCHTISVAGTQGSATNVRTRERKDGPNFDQRKEEAADVIYAIENGGFSSGPMPQDILTGDDAKAVADFIAKYSGSKAARPPSPQQSTSSGQ